MKIKIDGAEAKVVFEACHLVPGNGKCSRLHPHFHKVSVVIDGSLSSKRRVLHLYKLKYMILEICNELDGKVLLAQYPENIMHVEKNSNSVKVSVNGKTYSLPEEDVMQLPISSLNTEDMCLYFSDRIIRGIKDEFDISRINWVEVIFDEGHGQIAANRVILSQSPTAKARQTV
ncbi:6-pyruvoyl tetrahydropterin synthase [archaeon BMS3Bbin15]|nr:6-pyruvoyl tetrahydropterin synthase [archaeon BMS3Bbin15]